MKFAIFSTRRKTDITKYIDVIKKYNISTIKITNTCDSDEKAIMYYVDISTIEELMELRKDLGKELIICDEFSDEFYNEYDEPALEIYDCFRE
jgi:hypothetical protein